MRLMFAMFCVVGVAFAGCSKDEPQPTVTVAGQAFTVEIADEPHEHTIGLSGRRTLADDAGMLFVFKDAQVRAFYMKDCYFPIDVAFLDENRVILNLTTMPVEADPGNPKYLYKSQGRSRYVLEAVGGTWERIGAKAGDVVQFRDVFIPR